MILQVSALDRVLQIVPARLIRAVGQGQFRSPFLRRLVRMSTPALTMRRGTIARGVGAGLVFDATGGYPGYLFGTTEPAEQVKIAEMVNAGGVFYDIGAHIGFYATIAARRVGPSGHVYAFEPFASSAQQVSRNAEANNLMNVTVVQAAVADAPGTMHLQLGDSSAANRLAPEGPGVPVEVIAIDSWRHASRAAAPTVVMIDAEGSEIDVLVGMRETIRSARPTIMCEVHWLGAAFTNYVGEELEPLGYRLEALEGEIPEGRVRWHAVLTVL